MKKCTACLLEKPESEFSSRGKKKDGTPSLRARCKTCISKQDSRYYQNNRDRIIQRERDKYTPKTSRDSSQKTKKCVDCNETLTEENRYATRLLCLSCGSIRKSEYDKQNKVESFIRHGLSKEEYEHLSKLFNGLCHLCQSSPAKVIDHDHACCPGVYSCGACVRGILCHNCTLD